MSQAYRLPFTYEQLIFEVSPFSYGYAYLGVWAPIEVGAIVTIAIEQDVAGSGPAPEQESNPDIGENQSPHDGSCANPRCRKGPNETRGILKSVRAKYCCPYCRVDVYRRSRPKPEQIEKLTRRRRRDAKYTSHSERQRASWARHRPSPLPEAIKDYLAIEAGRTVVVGKRVPEPK
jgi:hypothetical protein